MSKKVWLCSASDARLPQAKVLADSVYKHTNYSFGRLNPEEGTSAKRYPQLIELFVTQQRLSAALKLLTEGAEEVVISGADYVIYGPLPELSAEYGRHPCLFCPHVLSLMPDGPQQQNVNLTRAGVINSDFQVWRNTLKVREFLRAVITELQGPLERFRDSFDFEQAWLPYALSCAGGALITHPGYGVAYYNLHERKVFSYGGTNLQIDTEDAKVPLRTFHFSGMEFTEGARFLTRFPHPFKRGLNSAENTIVENYRREVSQKMTC